MVNPDGGQGDPVDQTRLERTDELQPGGQLAGRYRIEKELGRGGIGVVYLASDLQLEGRPVVVKVLLEQSTASAWLQKKFRDEIRALVRIDHPGVVGVLDAGTTSGGRSFFVMQFVNGSSLRQLLESGPLPLADAADIIRQAGQALAAAHERGVYHRDLKPENLMLQELGPGQRAVKIIDFGIATVKDSLQAETHVTQVAGTPLYMAPEQLGGRPGAGSDTWALAVMAYEMLTGRLPFQPSSPYALLPMQKQGTARRPGELRPGLPPGCDEILLRGLAFEPERRPSARELGEGLARALVGVGGSAPSGAGGPAAVRRLFSPRLALTVLGCLALVLGGFGFARRYLPGGRAPALPTVTAPAQAGPRWELAYSLTVQKYRDGRPYREPFLLPGEMLFGPDDRIRLVVSAPEPGHLYVVNEGPASAAGSPSFHILFPSPTANAGVSALPTGRQVQIPESSWFVFDEQQGTERLWLVWARQSQAPLEALGRFANPRDQGRISDTAAAAELRRFLEAGVAPPPSVSRDESAQRTVLTASADVLVHLVKLEHR